MKRVRITVIRKAHYPDLIERYENPIEEHCDLREGQVFIAEGWQKPDGLCESAWQTLSPFVMALAHGATNFYDGWMKNPASALLSCNDGFRPVSFLVEALDETESAEPTFGRRPDRAPSKGDTPGQPAGRRRSGDNGRLPGKKPRGRQTNPSDRPLKTKHRQQAT